MKTCILYLVRHGETEWNVKKLIQGHKDIPLNSKGKKQAQKLAVELKSIFFDAIYSSDLKRASQTANIIAEERDIKVTFSRNLRERFVGIFQGKDYGREKNMLKIIDNLKRASPEDVNEIENDETLLKRFVGFLKAIAKKNIGKTILVATHAGPMRTFLIKLGWGTYENLTEGCIDNLAFVKLLYDEKGFSVESVYGISKK